MTECNQSSFGFKALGGREIVARFEGGTISSDGGALLLRETDQRLNPIPRLAECFFDGRNRSLVERSIGEMLWQGIHGLALGCEDLDDHEHLLTDPVFGILAGKRDLTEPLAGKSALNRLELGTGVTDRYKKIVFRQEAVDELPVGVFIESHQPAPAQIMLDRNQTGPVALSESGFTCSGTQCEICGLALLC
jgi:hypothetical protein